MKAPPEKLGSFYLGAQYDLNKSQITENLVNYDARDLTTHAVCFGMTGSGKTGLCVGLLEEAALDKVPAIIIDPKGDITNLMLQFPNLQPHDFKPWINPDDARRKGKTIDEYAQITADLWRKGLSEWGIDSTRMKALQDSADFAIFTPGSEAGIPISLLSSLAAPKLSFEENSEIIREQITGTVSALLELAGVDVDPVRSREAILLATIFEYFWKKKQDLDLAKLISSIQKPHVRKLGVFDVDTFYPEKERFGLAMAFNSLIASPNFQSWLKGESLDIDGLLYNEHGKPRHCIFYLAHLSERERMLFVTLLLEKVLIWVRSQTGTTSLRALLYFDEVFGFMPPVAEPPSKRPLITLLKQARAFGLGCVLVTQNPVDIDYKGLTNIGTWFIGKLQTERDKKRVLEGLRGVASNTGVNTSDYSDLISGLSSRVFLYHNVHENEPVVFYTRWVMSYLRGPLTRPQVRQLMDNRKKLKADIKLPTLKSSMNVKASEVKEIEGLSQIPPTISPSIPQLFLPLRSSETEIKQSLTKKFGPYVFVEKIQLCFKPTIFGSGNIRFFDRKQSIDKQIERSLIIEDLEKTSFIDWKLAQQSSVGINDLLNAKDQVSDRDAFFDLIPDVVNSPDDFKKLNKKLNDFLYYNSVLKLKMSDDLEVIQKPDESDRDFKIRLLQESREVRDAEVDKIKEKYAKKLDKLGDKLSKLEFNLIDNEEDYKARKREELVGAGESVLSIFMGSRRTSRATTIARRRRMTSKAKRKVDETKEDIARLQKDISELEAELKKVVDKIVEKYENVSKDLGEKELKPKRTDVKINLVALAWKPYWVIHYKEKGVLKKTTLES
ncbi:MAG: DUF87 domain-containing protein [Candidatus Bathyarchaeota archaeon]